MSTFLGGCTGITHLRHDEKLLEKQRIKAPRGTVNREAVRYLYVQKANRTLLRTRIKPLVALYYGFWGTQSYDQEKYIRRRARVEKKFNDKIAATTSEKKINNYQFRKHKKLARLDSFIEDGNLWMQWGEPIAVFDSASVGLTQQRISDYLFANGYFLGSVSADIKFKGAKNRIVEVDYVLTPGRPYHIDTLFYDVDDSVIVRLLDESVKNSLLKPGERYKQDNLSRERERIDMMLKEHGFYDFSRQYIEFEADTVHGGNERLVSIKLIIHEPEKRGYHKQFVIDSVQFITDASISRPAKARVSRMYRDINYSYYNDDYNLKILSQRVFIHAGEYYSRSKTMNTQRQLANVDAFKFININFDTTGGKFMANIYSSPLPRYEWSNEAGVNVTQGFPGPYYSIAFRKRNLFKGLETFELSGRFGFEGVASVTSQQNIYKSSEGGVNATFTFPQFIFPFREPTRFRLAKYNPKTKLTTGYSFTDRPEFRRTAVSLNGTYTWQNNKFLTYSLSPINVSVINIDTLSTEFQNFLRLQQQLGNNRLVNSFNPSFINSVIFGLTWNRNNYGNIESNSSFLRTQIEKGGTIWNIVDPEIVTRNNLQYFKYIRLGADYRAIKVINPTTIFAFRVNAGVAYSYADVDSLSVPYEKFFFAGGSNSIRAWRPRRLGPGSSKPLLSDRPRADGMYNYSIEKPGEILLEGSAELRQKLFGFVSGAVFVDAGNVWTFQPTTRDESDGEKRSGKSHFTVNDFYNEIAVGTGFGLRFDFTFLILRFDVGMKVFDPARDAGDRFVLNKARFWQPYATRVGESYTNFREPVIYNVGIGYSF